MIEANKNLDIQFGKSAILDKFEQPDQQEEDVNLDKLAMEAKAEIIGDSSRPSDDDGEIDYDV